MKIDTALNHKARFISSLEDIWGSARCFSSPHTQILEDIDRKIYKDPSFARCPGWVKSEVKAYSASLLSNVYRFDVIWGAWHKGKFYSKYSEMSKDLKDLVRDKKVKMAHYWTRQESRVEENDKTTVTFKVTEKQF
jgi:predicted transcriptional regulator with HTH domain